MITDIDRQKLGKLQEMFPDNDLCLAEKFDQARSNSKCHIEFKNRKKKWCSIVVDSNATIEFLAKQIMVLT